MKKIKIYLSIILLALASIASAQTRLGLTGVAIKSIKTLSFKDQERLFIEAGTRLDLSQMVYKEGSVSIIVAANNNSLNISPDDLNRILIDMPKDQDALWGKIQLTSSSYKGFLSRPIRYDLRNELEEEALQSLYKLDKFYGFFEDQYVDDYLQSLLYRIHSIALNDRRPGNLFIKVLKLNDPNAYCIPNGTIVITTGLLSMINSEAELIGVLSHEVAHFVLDHQVDNILKDAARQKQAEFWAGLTTLVAAAGEAYVNTKYDIYTGGSLTMGTAIATSAISNSVAQRMGTKYSQNQEMEADKASQQVLKYLNMDTLAFSSVLMKLQDYYSKAGNYYALTGEGDHPDIVTRINDLGVPKNETKWDNSFVRRITTVITLTAIEEFNAQHLLICSDLTDKNIQSGCATEDDYILKAKILRKLYDSEKSNEQALVLLMTAKGLNVTPRIQVDKEIGLTLLRLNKTNEAVKYFSEYQSKLASLEVNEKDKEFVNYEIEWASIMIHKCTVLTSSSKN